MQPRGEGGFVTARKEKVGGTVHLQAEQAATKVYHTEISPAMSWTSCRCWMCRNGTSLSRRVGRVAATRIGGGGRSSLDWSMAYMGWIWAPGGSRVPQGANPKPPTKKGVSASAPLVYCKRLFSAYTLIYHIRLSYKHGSTASLDLKKLSQRTPLGRPHRLPRCP